jgi:hypothetical protein
MAMHEFPLVSLTTKDLCHAQAERDDFGLALKMHIGPLDADPISDAITGPHVKDLDRVCVVRSERRCVACIATRHCRRSLDDITSWAEKGGRIVVRREAAERTRVAVHIGESRLFALPHELLKVFSVAAHDFSPVLDQPGFSGV